MFLSLIFFRNLSVLKSSHGSANFSVLGNRSVKNETSPSGERQVSKITWSNLEMLSINCDVTEMLRPTVFRQHQGGRAQKEGRTQRQGSLWAVRAERSPPPLALDSPRTGIILKLKFTSLLLCTVSFQSSESLYCHDIPE